MDEGEVRLIGSVVVSTTKEVDEDDHPTHPTASSIAEAPARKTLLIPI